MAYKYLTTVALLLISVLLPTQTVLAGNISSGDSGLLWLVNRSNMLTSSYVPPNLCEYQGIRLQSVARDAFVQMLKSMEEDGIYGLRLQSAYRSYSYQQAVFNQREKELKAKGHSKSEAENMASKSIQPPGASEHQLGLSLDVSIDGKLTQAFGETKAGKWLEEHSHKYGFVIRYPSSKTEITQIIYEPWHLRYVGTPHSTIMKNLVLTLEEYLSYIKQINMYIFWEENCDYYFLLYSNSLPEVLPPGTIDISAFTSGETEYIITTRKSYPTIW